MGPDSRTRDIALGSGYRSVVTCYLIELIDLLVLLTDQSPCSIRCSYVVGTVGVKWWSGLLTILRVSYVPL